MNGSRGSSSHFADSSLVQFFLKRWGPLPELRRRVTRPSARGVSPRVPLGQESHFRPVRQGRASRFYRIAPKIIETLKPHHDDNVGTQSAGKLYLCLARELIVHPHFPSCVKFYVSETYCLINQKNKFRSGMRRAASQLRLVSMNFQVRYLDQAKCNWDFIL